MSSTRIFQSTCLVPNMSIYDIPGPSLEVAQRRFETKGQEENSGGFELGELGAFSAPSLSAKDSCPGLKDSDGTTLLSASRTNRWATLRKMVLEPKQLKVTVLTVAACILLSLLAGVITAVITNSCSSSCASAVSQRSEAPTKLSMVDLSTGVGKNGFHVISTFVKFVTMYLFVTM